MRKLLLSILFVLFSYYAFSQQPDTGWQIYHSGYLEENRGINSISILNSTTDDVAWTIAYDGSGSGDQISEVAYTNNGGHTWTAYDLSTALPGITNPGIGTVFPTDINTAYIAAYSRINGQHGGIWKTTNAGASWSKVSSSSMFSNTNSFCNIVYFVDSNNGFCQGDPINGEFEMYYTTDAGATWTPISGSDIDNPISGEYGYIHGYAAAGNTIWFTTSRGRLFRSTDQGHTWTAHNTPLNDFSGDSDSGDVTFKDDNEGWLVRDNGELYHTTDAGDNWTQMTPTYDWMGSSNNPKPFFGGNIAYIPGTANTLIVTESDTTKPVYGAAISEDGGQTWTKMIYYNFEGGPWMPLLPNRNFQHLAVAFRDINFGLSGGFSHINNPNNSNDTFTQGIFVYSTVPELDISSITPKNVINNVPFYPKVIVRKISQNTINSFDVNFEIKDNLNNTVFNETVNVNSSNLNYGDELDVIATNSLTLPTGDYSITVSIDNGNDVSTQPLTSIDIENTYSLNKIYSIAGQDAHNSDFVSIDILTGDIQNITHYNHNNFIQAAFAYGVLTVVDKHSTLFFVDGAGNTYEYGKITGLDDNHVGVYGLAFNSDLNTFYISTKSRVGWSGTLSGSGYLYDFNFNNLTVTLISNQTTYAGPIAIDDNGQLWEYDDGNDNVGRLYSVNPTDASLTLVGESNYPGYDYVSALTSIPSLESLFVLRRFQGAITGYDPPFSGFFNVNKTTGKTSQLLKTNGLYSFCAIKGVNLLDNDLKTESITTNIYNKNKPFNIGASITNFGKLTQNNFDVNFVIKDSANNIVYDETVSVSDAISFRGSLDISTTIPVSLDVGNYTITVTTLLPGDENPANDSISEPLQIVDFGSYEMNKAYSFIGYDFGNGNQNNLVTLDLINGDLTDIGNLNVPSGYTYYLQTAVFAEDMLVAVSKRNHLYFIDENANIYEQGEIKVPRQVNSIAYNTSTGKTYITTRTTDHNLATKLYELDISTLKVELVSELHDSNGNVIRVGGIAFDNNNNLVDNTGSYYQIDISTGLCTALNSNINTVIHNTYVKDKGVDPTSGSFFAVTCDKGGLYHYNTTGIEPTIIGHEWNLNFTFCAIKGSDLISKDLSVVAVTPTTYAADSPFLLNAVIRNLSIPVQNNFDVIYTIKDASNNTVYSDTVNVTGLDLRFCDVASFNTSTPVNLPEGNYALEVSVSDDNDVDVSNNVLSTSLNIIDIKSTYETNKIYTYAYNTMYNKPSDRDLITVDIVDGSVNTIGKITLESSKSYLQSAAFIDGLLFAISNDGILYFIDGNAQAYKIRKLEESIDYRTRFAYNSISGKSYINFGSELYEFDILTLNTNDWGYIGSDCFDFDKEGNLIRHVYRYNLQSLDFSNPNASWIDISPDIDILSFGDLTIDKYSNNIYTIDDEAFDDKVYKIDVSTGTAIQLGGDITPTNPSNNGILHFCAIYGSENLSISNISPTSFCYNTPTTLEATVLNKAAKLESVDFDVVFRVKDVSDNLVFTDTVSLNNITLDTDATMLVSTTSGLTLSDSEYNVECEIIYNKDSESSDNIYNSVIYLDNIAPTPDIANLPDITAVCEVTTLTPPTATDNCSGNVTVTNDATLPINTQGTTVVTWTYDDGNGNTSTQMQNVIIDDTTAPVPDMANLPDITAECEVTTLTPPTATDNCAGSLSATSDVTLPITNQGTTVITWTYDDGNGNTSTQTQNVIINDNDAPVPDVVNLPDITAECEVTTLTPPTATDNCSSNVTVTNNANLPINTQGTTVVTWTYDDGNGNTSTQTQNVIIDDITAPDAPSNFAIGTVTETSIAVSTDVATDNCGSIDHYNFYLDTNIDGAANGNVSGTSVTPSYTYTSLISGTTYELYVTAVDEAGNESNPSTVVVSTTLGVDNPMIQGFNIYPNPTENILHITADENIKHISITNNLGQKVYDNKTNAKQIEISLASFAKGTYFIKANSAGGSVVRVVFKK